MKKFLIKIAVFFGGMTLLSVGTVFIPMNPCAYDAEFIDKQARLNERKSPKIVFIGGSNCAFGLDSPAISEKLKIPVLNDGLHAGSGMYFIMDTTAPRLRKGDIAVLAFEYAHFFGEAEGGWDASNCAFYHKDVFRDLKRRSLKTVLTNYPSLAEKTLHAFAAFCIRGKWRSSKPYSRDSFNEFGDCVGHLNLPNKPVRPIRELRPLDSDAVRFFAREAHALRARGVKVLVFPPVIQASSYENLKPRIDELQARLSEFGISYDADPSRYALPDDCFYDTPYHANKDGREIRTVLAEEDLLRLLNDF